MMRIDMLRSYVNELTLIKYLLDAIVDAQNLIGRDSGRDKIAGIGVGIGRDRFFAES